MSNQNEQQSNPSSANWQGLNWDKSGPGALPVSGQVAPAGDVLSRFLGGSPVAVAVRLVLMSLVVGAMLVWLDIHPYDVFRALERFVQRIWFMGFDAIREIASYVLAGAVIVVPVWLLLRLMNMRGK